MPTLNFKIQWQTHGFKPEDLNPIEWKVIQDEFMRLYDIYCEYANGRHGYAQFNKDFDRKYLYSITNRVDGTEGYLYGSYMTFRSNEALKYAIKYHSEILEPFIFMDGAIPVFGAKLKNREKCDMDFTLIPEED